MRACVCACVNACVRTCACVCVRTYVCVCVRVCVSQTARFIHNLSFQFDLGHNVVSDLIPFVEDSLKLVKASVNKVKDFKCETSSFVKLMYERSRSHLTKDNHYIQIKSDKGHSLNPDQI